VQVVLLQCEELLFSGVLLVLLLQKGNELGTVVVGVVYVLLASSQVQVFPYVEVSLLSSHSLAVVDEVGLFLLDEGLEVAGVNT